MLEAYYSPNLKIERESGGNMKKMKNTVRKEWDRNMGASFSRHKAATIL